MVWSIEVNGSLVITKLPLHRTPGGLQVIETSSQKHVNQQFDSVACRHSDFARSEKQEMESMFCTYELRTAM